MSPTRKAVIEAISGADGDSVALIDSIEMLIEEKEREAFLEGRAMTWNYPTFDEYKREQK